MKAPGQVHQETMPLEARDYSISWPVILAVCAYHQAPKKIAFVCDQGTHLQEGNAALTRVVGVFITTESVDTKA